MKIRMERGTKNQPFNREYLRKNENSWSSKGNEEECWHGADLEKWSHPLQCSRWDLEEKCEWNCMRSGSDQDWGCMCFGFLGFREDEWKWKVVVEKVCWPEKMVDVTWSSAAEGGKGVRAAAWGSSDQRTWEGQRESCLHGWIVVMLEWVEKGKVIGIRCCSFEGTARILWLGPWPVCLRSGGAVRELLDCGVSIGAVLSGRSTP